MTNKPESWQLGSGTTPLVEAVRTAPPGQLSFKLESLNPTGSYKDRFAVAQVREMLARGVRSCVATSSGNTGAALATYCRRAGLECMIVVNEDAPAGKLQQMSAMGARVLCVPGFVSDPSISAAVFGVLRRLSEEQNVPLVVSAFAYCPVGMQGVERISEEIASAQVDHVFVPIGGAGLYSAIVQGFLRCGTRLPRVHAVQPAGCLTLVGAWLEGEQIIPSPVSTTQISGLSVPNDIDSSRALALLLQCGGTGIAVTDDEVFLAQEELFLNEGVYCEPAGATAFAGWKRALAEGTIRPGERSICLVTGHGFKDPTSAGRIARKAPQRTVGADQLQGVLIEMMGGHDA